jgi:putative endonuclease
MAGAALAVREPVVSRARVALGEIGENLACDELQRRGYEILARRYRRRGGEIDIIAIDGPTLVFIEVKTRSGTDFGSGAEAITRTKRRRIMTVAMEFVARERFTDRSCRFDVVSIELAAEGPIVQVYRNAFDAGGSGFGR